MFHEPELTVKKNNCKIWLQYNFIKGGRSAESLVRTVFTNFFSKTTKLITSLSY